VPAPNITEQIVEDFKSTPNMVFAWNRYPVFAATNEIAEPDERELARCYERVLMSSPEFRTKQLFHPKRSTPRPASVGDRFRAGAGYCLHETAPSASADGVYFVSTFTT
jgi:hypothetical protein